MITPSDFDRHLDEDRGARPLVNPGFAAFPVADELVVLSPDGDMAHALNQTAAAVWRLCDGAHTPLAMVEALRTRYDGSPVRILADVTDALFRFQQLGLVDMALPPPVATHGGGGLVLATGKGPRRRFVFGVEDKPYFHWQVAILLESLVGQLASGWDITLVVCNDHAPPSPAMARLGARYGVSLLTGQNHAYGVQIDFAAHDGGYAALNRVEALKAIAPYVAGDDVVCLMDSDIFLYGDLEPHIFPAGNALVADEIMRDARFLGGGADDRGVDLQQLLSAIGCARELKRGAVTVFMTGATVKNDKVVTDCFRFAQVIYLMGKASGLSDRSSWMAEMACFAMALSANGIEHELLDEPRFITPLPEQATAVPGSFFHYYCDINDGRGGPFAGSAWNKQLFYDTDFLAENLESFRASAKTDHERRFFDLAIAARRRLQTESA